MAGAIRQPIDVASLQNYIERTVPQIETPIDVKQFGYGQSNPTYLLTDKTGGKYVMRKKPPGKLLSATAHRVDREYRIIHALEKTDVAVPKTYCLCEDDNVIGTPFYIMEFLDGRIFEDPSLPGVSSEERTALWKDAIRTLGKFHRISPKSVNLESFGKPTGFYNRQLTLFKSLSLAQANTKDIETQQPVGKIPHFEEMVTFFEQPTTQPQDRGTFIHGDYKIDNMVFHKTEPRVIGILDWEMSTIGHPLSDLSNLLSPYASSDSPHRKDMVSKSSAGGSGSGSGNVVNQAFSPGKTPGLPSYEQCIAWYAEVAGWDPTAELPWGNAFTSFKGAIIMQGIAARYAVRQASSAKAKDYGAMMCPMAEISWDMIKSITTSKGNQVAETITASKGNKVEEKAKL